MDSINLKAVYDALKDRYDLTYTNSFDVDDGFSENFPIILGVTHGRDFWLYDDYGEFVFSVQTRKKDYRDHWHPQTNEEAISHIIDFIEGR